MFKISFNPHEVGKIIKPEDLLPKTVENTRGELMPFEPKRIIDSLIKETSLDKEKAILVTTNVLRKISSLGLDFIAAPHIRELVCGELTSQGLNKYRNRYTRLGIPIYDVKMMLSGAKNGIKSTNNNEEQSIQNVIISNQSNPTLSYQWIAGQVIEQYVHLDQLTEKARSAHLKGLIHIDHLQYWDQPISQQWDLRTILVHGLPPINWTGVAKSSPAQNALTAASHAAKWFQLIHSEFSGPQGYDNFTVLLAPYLKDLPYKSEKANEIDIMQVAQTIIFETNQVFGNILGKAPEVYIICSPDIPDSLENVDAIGPGGKVVGKYKDYKEECRLLFRALAEVYGKGDAEGKPILIPQHRVKITKKGIAENKEDLLFLIEKETLQMGNTYFINSFSNQFSSKIVSCCLDLPLERNTNDKIQNKEKNSEQTEDNDHIFDYSNDLNNFGVLQNLTINMIRLAYISKEENKTIFELLDELLPVCEEILVKKYELINDEVKNKRTKLPYCAGNLVDNPYGYKYLFDLSHQYLTISFSGLAAAIKIINEKTSNDNELINSQKYIDLGKEIIKYLQDYARKAKTERNLPLEITGHAIESPIQKFVKTDNKFVNNKIRSTYKISPLEYQVGANIIYPEESDSEIFFKYIKSIGEWHNLLRNGTIFTLNWNNVKREKDDFYNLLEKLICDFGIGMLYYPS